MRAVRREGRGTQKERHVEMQRTREPEPESQERVGSNAQIEPHSDCHLRATCHTLL